MKNFPEAGRLITEAFDLLKQRRGRGLSVREAAKELGVSPAALSAWMHGQRAPRDKKLQQMATFFFGEATEQKQFYETLADALKSGAVESDDPLEALTSDQRGIRVGVIEYEWFCRNPEKSKEGGFLDHIFQRFLAFAALPTPGIHWESLRIDQAMRAMTETNSADITLSLLATVDRTLKLKFYTSPIRIRVNAVIHKDNFPQKNKVTAALSMSPMEQRSAVVYPLIQEMEVGGNYVIKTLGFLPKTYRSTGYALTSYNDYAKALKEHRPGGAIPVAVADEYSCAQIIRAMGGEGDFVFPIGESSDPQRELLPSYALGLAINRNHEKWVNYLNDALSLYLDADTEAVSYHYYVLWGKLLNEYREVLEIAGYDKAQIHDNTNTWVKRTLGIDDDPSPARTALIGGKHIAPWQAILVRAQKWVTGTGSKKTPITKADR